MCHSSCLTCTSDLFNSCTSCPAAQTLVSGICYCDTNWQSQCSSEIALRELLMFLDMFMTVLIVALMIMYALKVRLPISYRLWSGLNALSLLIYSDSIYLQYEDYFSLKTLSFTNGPYFMPYRIMPVSVSHILPTAIVGICTLSLIFLFYFPYQAFNTSQQSFLDYLKEASLFYFDCFYIFAGKIMYMFIGKTINQLLSSTVDALPIAFMSIYGVVCILSIIRVMVLYHRGTIQTELYEPPIFLYTMLSPITMVGLCLITSQQLLTIVYCAPLALLLLILLLNRNMKICIKKNIIFFVTQILFVGFIVAYILVDDIIKTYVIVVIDFICIIVVLIEVTRTYYGGVDLSNVKVYPEEVQDYERPKKKKILGQEEAQHGYI